MAFTNGMVYDEGYEDGYKGLTPSPAYKGDKWYEEGFDAGKCDRPSLEELSMDVVKKRFNPPF